MGAPVVFETGPALIRLVAKNRLYDRLLVGLSKMATRPVDRFDFHVSLLSLSYILKKGLGPEISDFADTAAIMEHLDLIISVDTSVVHLAGALEKPVWTLLPFASDFRWLLDRDDSPWYPSMRLFRQTSPKEWGPVLDRVALALAQRVASAS